MLETNVSKRVNTEFKDDPLELFLEHRKLLFGLAYRMLGTKAEAEDVLQEVYLRWHHQALADIESPRAWLTACATRMCIDVLRRDRHRENYTGSWLPGPLIDHEIEAACPSQAQTMLESLSLAFLLMLERLNPTERAVFLLKDIFEYRFEDISSFVGKSSANCRQIASRARAKMDESSLPTNDIEANQSLLNQFVSCFTQGDMGALKTLLHEDVTLISDGGGKVLAVLHPLHGVERNLQLFSVLLKGAFKQLTMAKPIIVNGQPGIYLVSGSERSLYSIEAEEGKVTRIFVLRNPDKLPRL